MGRSAAAVLFDLDGTLVDTAPDLVGALYQLLDEMKLGRPDFDKCRNRVSQGARGLIHIGLGMTPEDAGYEEYRQRFLSHYEIRLSAQSALFPGVDELLQQLDQGAVPWGIATNKPHRYAEPLLEDLGLLERCQFLLTPDHVGAGKPDPAMVYRAVEQFEINPEACWFIGDAEQDVVAGRAAGARTVVANWGYIGDLQTGADWDADYLLDHPLDLIELLSAEAE